MSAEGFYRRPLPEALIAFSSSEGRQIFREALEMEGMAGYFPLAEQFHTQAEPAFCGLGTLVIVLNALLHALALNHRMKLFLLLRSF